MVAANQPTSSAAVPAERIAELEQHFHDLLQHPLSTKSSKDEAEPIIDFVENKAQISWLTPLIFIFAFVLGSAIVISGSALIGPENILGLTPGRPSAIKALCRSPVHDLIHNAFDANLTAKHTFVGTYLGWTALLEPPTDLCADIEKSEDQVDLRRLELDLLQVSGGRESIDFATAPDREEIARDRPSSPLDDLRGAAAAGRRVRCAGAPHGGAGRPHDRRTQAARGRHRVGLPHGGVPRRVDPFDRLG